MKPSTWIVLILTLLAAGCSAPEGQAEGDTTWVGTITTEDNVTTVVNESGSVWGGTATLVEEASIGVEAGEEPYMVGQEASPPLLTVYGAAGGELYFDDIRATSIEGGVIVVLTPPGPAVHVLDRGRVRSWGREGQGPGELMDPVDVVLHDGRVSVLDQGNRRISSFDVDGRLLDTRSTASFWANRLAFVRGELLLGTFVPMDRERSVTRLIGDDAEEILSYTSATATIRLEAPGAPSFTVSEPYASRDLWTPVPEVGLAYWRADSGELKLLDTGGRVVRTIEIPPGRFELKIADREHWFRTAIPESFMGQEVFEPIRERARSVIEFPDVFAPVLALMGDPLGAIWIRRTSAGSGEIWTIVDLAGEQRGNYELPPGRQLLTIGSGSIVSAATDEYGDETIEVYERRRSQRPGSRTLKPLPGGK